MHRWIQQTRTRGECGGGGGQRRLGGQQWWGGQGQWGRRGRWGWHGWKGWWGLGIFFAKMLRTTKYNNLPNLVRQAQREQVCDDILLLPVIIKTVEPVCLRNSLWLQPPPMTININGLQYY